MKDRQKTIEELEKLVSVLSDSLALLKWQEPVKPVVYSEGLCLRRKAMKKVKIECDLAMKERIKTVFAEDTDRCFFGPGAVWCGDYMTPDGPDCARCIEENVEWTVELDE